MEEGGGLFPYARQDSLHNHGHVVAFSWVLGTPLSHMSGPLESAAWAWDGGINYKLRKKQAHTVHAKKKYICICIQKSCLGTGGNWRSKKEASVWWPFMGGQKNWPGCILGDDQAWKCKPQVPQILTLFYTQGDTRKNVLSGLWTWFLGTCI